MPYYNGHCEHLRVDPSCSLAAVHQRDHDADDHDERVCLAFLTVHLSLNTNLGHKCSISSITITRLMLNLRDPRLTTVSKRTNVTSIAFHKSNVFSTLVVPPDGAGACRSGKDKSINSLGTVSLLSSVCRLCIS